MKERLFWYWPTITKVRQMGAYETLITFDTIEDMEVELTIGADYMKNYFGEIRKWSDEEQCKTRKVWLECFGMPPHA